MERSWTCVIPLSTHEASACPSCHTWAAVEAGSSSSSRSSMVAAWSSRGSITILALEARSSERHVRMGGLGQWHKRDHWGTVLSGDGMGRRGGGALHSLLPLGFPTPFPSYSSPAFCLQLRGPLL